MSESSTMVSWLTRLSHSCRYSPLNQISVAWPRTLTERVCSLSPIKQFAEVVERAVLALLGGRVHLSRMWWYLSASTLASLSALASSSRLIVTRVSDCLGTMAPSSGYGPAKQLQGDLDVLDAVIAVFRLHTEDHAVRCRRDADLGFLGIVEQVGEFLELLCGA